MVHRYLMQETELLPPTEPDNPLKLRLDREEPDFSARSIIWLTTSLLFRISMHCSIRDSGSFISRSMSVTLSSSLSSGSLYTVLGVIAPLKNKGELKASHD